MTDLSARLRDVLSDETLREIQDAANEAQAQALFACPLQDCPASHHKALAACYRRADAENRAKLVAAFEGLFTEYKEMARLAATPQEQK